MLLFVYKLFQLQMESLCYWLNPDDERQSYYVHLHPFSSINISRPTNTKVNEEGRRKRRKKLNGYIPNEREQQANKYHEELLPHLLKALKNFEIWKNSKSNLLTTPSSWISPQSPDQASVDNIRVFESPPSGAVSWAALEKLKRVVKPKFYHRDEIRNEHLSDLFTTLHRNNDKVEKVCFAHESQIVFPRQSSFVMSDIAQLPDLVDGKISLMNKKIDDK